MNFTVTSELWLGLGAFLIFLEFFAPGLVSVFVGMGALTVAAGIYWEYLPSLTSQLLTWFFSSIVYLFTIRLLVLRFYPQNTNRSNVNEDEMVIGTVVTIAEDIPGKGIGRIFYSDSTWKARSKDSLSIAKGTKVKICGRENITYVVEKIK